MDEKKINSGMALTALGVVYGDIGTSPLYALKESFHHLNELPVVEHNVLGVLSLIFWSLLLIISLKYNLLILKADNNGEGGILALTALISNVFKKNAKRTRYLTYLGIFGASLLYGDGMITPAISVLSAVEGLELIQPKLHPFILPLTILILILLFSAQKHGTSKVGKVFGPVTLIWFLTIGLLGFVKIVSSPHVLWAMSPHYAFNFFMNNGTSSFMVLGSVFLVVTGGEALYSDLGHFGRAPIKRAWFSIVLPSLLLNYFGQGALIIENASAVRSPFYLLAPDWGLIPLVILATIATVIASQALITGVFSLTMQAVQLHYFPRMEISHTSQTEFGQIYVGKMNIFLMISCIALVVFFRSSSALAAAYGIAVTMTMLITTILFFYVVRYNWKWSPYIAVPLCGFIGIVEMSYMGANLFKILHGGWFTIFIGIFIFSVMTTWNKGRRILSERMLEIIFPLTEFIKNLKEKKIHRNPGYAVYMASQPLFVPPTLKTNLRHYSSIHEITVILTVRTEKVPFVKEKKRAIVDNVGPGIYKIQLHYGFMEIPDVPKTLSEVKLNGKKIPVSRITYYLGQELLLPKDNGRGMALWREKLFSFMTRNSQAASRFFNLPPDQVVTVGLTIEL